MRSQGIHSPKEPSYSLDLIISDFLTLQSRKRLTGRILEILLNFPLLPSIGLVELLVGLLLIPLDISGVISRTAT